MIKRQYELELKITNNGIQSNLNEIKQAIDNQYMKYATLVEVEPDEQRIKELKEVRTQANKICKTIDDERKKAVSKYKDTVSQAKNMVDDTMSAAKMASDNIKRIIDEYEAGQDKQRKAHLEAIYNEIVAQYSDVKFTFEQLYDTQFKDLLHCYQDDNIRKQINLRVTKINGDVRALKVIALTKIEYLTLLGHYMNVGYDLTKAIKSYKNEQSFRNALNNQIGNNTKKKEKTTSRSLTIKATDTQLDLLKDYLISNNIKFKLNE